MFSFGINKVLSYLRAYTDTQDVIVRVCVSAVYAEVQQWHIIGTIVLSS